MKVLHFQLILIGLCVSANVRAQDTISERHADSAEAYVVDLTATDFAFAMPSEIKSGWVTFKFNNIGKKTHVAQIMSLKGDIGPEKFNKILSSGEYPPVDGLMGGPGLHTAGQSSEITVHLEPGTYAMICGTHTEDGTPHYALGMVKHITVMEEKGAAQPPVSDMKINLENYELHLSGELETGRQTIEINGNNAIYDLHLIANSDPSTYEEAFRYFRGLQDPTPVDFVGGVEEGHTTYLTLDMVPGDYMWSSHEFGEYGMYQRFSLSDQGKQKLQDDRYIGPAEILEATVDGESISMASETMSGAKEIHLSTGSESVHRIELTKLRPGFTLDDYRNWVKKQSEGMNPGNVPSWPRYYTVLQFDPLTAQEPSQLSMELSPGTYVLLCANRGDGNHLLDGELTAFEVR